MAYRHRARKARLQDRRPAAPSYDERAESATSCCNCASSAGSRSRRTARHRAFGADGNVSLEPAGQLELSGAPLDNLHQTCAETGRHLDQVKAIGEKCGVGFLGLGMWPDKRRDELPIMPKGRYASCSGTCRGSAISAST
jgi:glutamate--cysteine ligase